MKINFLLPGGAHTPIGGYRVIYEYANHLAALGHSVSITHPIVSNTKSKRRLFKLELWLTFFKQLITKQYQATSWMQVHPAVNMRLTPSLSATLMPDSDILVATAWQTAEWAADYPAAKGKRFYLIADYEFFMSGPPEMRARMAKTYRAGYSNVVISPACEDMVRQCGGRVTEYIPNGIDHDTYRLLEPVESPTRTWIGFPYRTEKFKRSDLAIAAFTELKKGGNCERFSFWTYGGRRPDDLPEWIKFVERPSDGKLVEWYNRSAIFLTPSDFEGWGLPGSEAMCCGAALVTSDNGGVRAYAEHGTNALISPIGDLAALTDNLKRLCEDDVLRVKLASEGNRQIRAFHWDRATASFEGLFLEGARTTIIRR